MIPTKARQACVKLKCDVTELMAIQRHLIMHGEKRCKPPDVSSKIFSEDSRLCHVMHTNTLAFCLERNALA